MGNRSIVVGLALITAACAGETTPGEAAADPAAVTCPPHIDRFPVAGPHNLGYDAQWNDFRCDSLHDNTDYGGDHHGIDVFALRGTPIVAPVDGVVTLSGTASSTSGLRVTLVDGCGWGYYHGHMDSIAPGIVAGAHVHAGDRIGTLGDTGTTGTAPHLHFNLQRDGNYYDDTDPFPYLHAATSTSCGADPHCTGRGDGSFCEGTHLSSCTAGRYGTGDCAAFGTTCGSSGGSARCLPLLDGVYLSSTFPGGTRIEVPVGHEVQGCLTYRNTGSWGWTHGTTKLGTTEARDRSASFVGSDWLGPNRIATIAAATATGATGRFCFSLHAAAAPGTRVEHFSLVEEGHFWAADVGGVPDATNYLTVVTVAAPPPPHDAGPHDAGARDAGHDAATTMPVTVTDAGADAGASAGDASRNADGGMTWPQPSAGAPMSGGCAVGPTHAGGAATWIGIALALVAVRRARSRGRLARP